VQPQAAHGSLRANRGCLKERHLDSHFEAVLCSISDAGRRYKEMNPRELKPTRVPEQPILLDGGWQEMTKSEVGSIVTRWLFV